ncbi:MAG: glycosyltransferase [Deltaproteobacteria bacterium]|nr:glycosyltransferase [Deltaproteobacteria bacterium]
MSTTWQEQINLLLQQKKFADALPLAEQELNEFKTVENLRTVIAIAIEAKLFKAAYFYLEQLDANVLHDASSYFFKALLFEKQGQSDAAISHYKIAFAINPANNQAFTNIKRLKGKSIADDQEQFDVVLCTGGIFFEKKFNANTLNERALGGSESALIYVAQALKNQGLKVAVFCNCDQPGQHQGVSYFEISEFAYRHALNQFPNIIATRFADPFLGNLNPKARHTLWLHDDAFTEVYRNFSPQNYRIDDVLFLSQSHQKRWQERFPDWTNSRFHQTTNGFDPNLFFPIPNPQSKKILFASRPERGLTTAVKVLENLRKQDPDYELLCCTYTQKENFEDDESYQAVQNALQTEGVRFLGSLAKPEFAKVMQSCRYLLHPNSLQNLETSCIVAIEAQACGVPVICQDGGALKETIQHNVTGLVLPRSENQTEAANALTKSIQELDQDPKKHSTLSKNAIKWANENYKWEDVVRKWRESVIQE